MFVWYFSTQNGEMSIAEWIREIGESPDWASPSESCLMIPPAGWNCE